MVVDVHYHLMPVVNEGIVEHTSKYAIQAAKTMGKTITPEEIKKKAFETWADPTGERLISDMAEAGIGLTVIYMVDNASTVALTPEMIQGANKIVGDVSRSLSGPDYFPGWY